MNQPKPGTPTMEAYQRVRRAISNQTLKPGKALTENYLCESLNMGRSPIRAALQQLALDGFVEISPNRSARVSQFTQDQIRHVYDLRGMVLFHALEKTIDTYGEKDIQFLTECLRRQECAFRDYNFEEYLDAIYDFFHYIISKAQNPYLDEIADSILKRLNVFLCLYDNFYTVKKLKTLPIHQKMIQGIQQKKLKTVMKAHDELSNRILTAYDAMILNNTD